MKVTVFSCGAAVNESETLAIEHLKQQLQNLGGSDEWVLLTNLAFSVTHQFQSDEIDVIAIGRSCHRSQTLGCGMGRCTRGSCRIGVASSSLPASDYPQSVAPEIQTQGLTAADQRSDVYSLCACLSGLFSGLDGGLSIGATEILAAGRAETPEHWCKLAVLDRSLSELLGDSVPPPPRIWTEDQTIRFHGGDYRIVVRLGSGGVGTTFKVVEVDRSTGEELGTYVAKVVHEGETGRQVLKAYGLARSHLGRHQALSPIHEFAREWHEDDFIALLG